LKHTKNLRTKLLGTSALAVLGSVWLGAGAATAVPAYVCDTVVGATTTVTCSGTEVGQAYAGDNTNITLNADADLSNSYSSTIQASGDTINLVLERNSSASTYNARRTVSMSGADNTVTLNDGAAIVSDVHATGAGSYSALAFFTDEDPLGGSITLNDGSSVQLIGGTYAGKYTNNFYGISAGGQDFTITLNDASSVTIDAYGTAGRGNYIGIDVESIAKYADERPVVTLNGTSQVVVNGTSYGSLSGNLVGISGDVLDDSKYAPEIVLNDQSNVQVIANVSGSGQAVGIRNNGFAPIVTLNDSSYVFVDGQDIRYAIGIAADGPEAAISLNGASHVSVIGHYTKYATGLEVETDNGTVVLNGSSYIQVAADYSDYTFGLNVGGDDNTVTLNGSSKIDVSGYDASYLYGASMRGSYNTLTMNGSSLVAVSGEYARGYAVTMFGNNNTLTLNDTAQITVAGSFNTYGVTLGFTSNSVITLNGSSAISAEVGTGIAIGGGSDNTISIGKDASVTGRTGISINGSWNELNIAGTVISTGTYAINLNGGNNTLTLNSATIDGRIRGIGSDHLVFQGEGILNDAVRGFGTLDVDASGIWDIAKYGSFDTVTINSGTLAVNGVLYADSGLTVANGGTLKGAGNVYGEISVLEGGTLAPGNSPGTLNVVGPVNFAAGSIFEVEVEGTAADLLNATGNVTIAPGAIIKPVFLGGVDGYVGDIITSGGAITGTFSVGSGGAVVYSGGAVSLTATSPSSMNASVGGSAAAGFSFLDTVMGQATAGAGTGENLWSSAIFDQSDRTANGTGKGYHQKNRGGAFGGTLMQTDATTVGLAGGYIDTDVDTVSGSSATSMSGFNLAAYGTYRFGGTVLTAAITGAYQDQDISRNVLVGGAIGKANGSPKAWLGGAGVGIAHPIPLEKGFTLTPKANIGWLHTTRDGYTETGGGAAAMSVNEISTETIRGQVGAELSVMIKDPAAQWSVRPNIHAGLAQEWRNGDANATGAFTATGAAFTAQLDNRDQTYLAIGAGVDVAVGPGLTAFASYDGGVSGDTERSGGFRLGARWSW
jgi:outer membrane autotransporter protein